jgi:long-subunit fatty acid transport protein
LYASAVALGIKPTVSVQLTDRLSAGVAPVIASMSLGLNPAFFAPLGGGAFPLATPGRSFWGAGITGGLLYQTDYNWDFGFAYHSPTWFERFIYNAQDAAGNPLEVTLEHTLPQIVSFGTAFHGFTRTTIALDVRYLDYANSKLWGDPIVAPGLRWDSIFSVAIGAQHQLTERLALRIGYLANENPIPDLATLFNIQLPAINQHQLSIGGSLQLTRAITMDTMVLYGFSNEIRGPLPIPGGLGTASVGLEQDLISVATSFRFAY